MITDFCVICGKKKDLHNHHIIPKSRGGGDEQINLITLCYQHHALIHQLMPNHWNKHSELVSAGIAESRKVNGNVWGRRTNLTDDSRKSIIRYRSCGMGIKKLSKKFSVSHQTIRKVLQDVDT